jgi:hypothetical protein
MNEPDPHTWRAFGPRPPAYSPATPPVTDVIAARRRRPLAEVLVEERPVRFSADEIEAG